MPLPELPETMILQDKIKINGRECEHWVEELGVERVHYYRAVDTQGTYIIFSLAVLSNFVCRH